MNVAQFSQNEGLLNIYIELFLCQIFEYHGLLFLFQIFEYDGSAMVYWHALGDSSSEAAGGKTFLASHVFVGEAR